jgi:putative ABC transport system ATP-binding protein
MAGQIIELIQRLNRDEGQTIILVTHDDAIGRSVPRLVVMRDGRLTSDEVLAESIDRPGFVRAT